jgi:hypothetical protein
MTLAGLWLRCSWGTLFVYIPTWLVAPRGGRRLVQWHVRRNGEGQKEGDHMS